MFFFFNDTATTEIYTLSLHDALPIWIRTEKGRVIGVETGRGFIRAGKGGLAVAGNTSRVAALAGLRPPTERGSKSTRLNTRHAHNPASRSLLQKKSVLSAVTATMGTA